MTFSALKKKLQDNFVKNNLESTTHITAKKHQCKTCENQQNVCESRYPSKWQSYVEQDHKGKTAQRLSTGQQQISKLTLIIDDVI